MFVEDKKNEICILSLKLTASGRSDTPDGRE